MRFISKITPIAVIFATGLYLFTSLNNRDSKEVTGANVVGEPASIDKSSHIPSKPANIAVNEAVGVLHAIEPTLNLKAELRNKMRGGVRVYRVGQDQITITPHGDIFILPEEI